MTPESPRVRCAIVLGGGRSSRMGTDKLELTVGNRSLLQRTCDASLGWADQVIVASPVRAGFPDQRIAFVLEDPPFGGPVAGIAAAVAALPGEAEEVLLLAGDLADPHAVVEALRSAPMGVDGVVLEDEEGWPQLLAGRYRAAALRLAVGRAPALRDVSVRRLLGTLDLARVAARPALVQDVDTPSQARLAGAEFRNYDGA
ncbi:MAG TPA: NTP transferase domain-containing protein [Arachnia sp.]|nr:NTP transferase domain-containing protein [Arachnia sp.]